MMPEKQPLEFPARPGVQEIMVYLPAQAAFYTRAEPGKGAEAFAQAIPGARQQKLGLGADCSSRENPYARPERGAGLPVQTNLDAQTDLCAGVPKRAKLGVQRQEREFDAGSSTQANSRAQMGLEPPMQRDDAQTGLNAGRKTGELGLGFYAQANPGAPGKAAEPGAGSSARAKLSAQNGAKHPGAGAFPGGGASAPHPAGADIQKRSERSTLPC